jgi:hypothetical protein
MAGDIRKKTQLPTHKHTRTQVVVLAVWPGLFFLFFLGQPNPVQHGQVLRDRYEGVGGNRARGRRGRHADARKGEVTRQQQALQRCFVSG